MIKKIEKDIKNKFYNDEKRLTHIYGVLELSLALAKKYGVDTDKMTIAALFHDYTKNDSLEAQKKHLSSYLVNRYKNVKEAYHGFSAANILENKYHYHESDVLNAIRYHVTGKKNMSLLAKILFVSDYSEKNRTHKEASFVREIALQDINEAFKIALLNKTKYVIEKGGYIDPNQASAIKEYETSNLEKIINELEDVKVKDLIVYDFEKTNPFYDYFVIATINDRQGSAAVTRIKKAIRDDLRHIEGKTGWILIDASDIIVHLFKEEEREFYGFDQKLIGVKRIK